MEVWLFNYLCLYFKLLIRVDGYTLIFFFSRWISKFVALLLQNERSILARMGNTFEKIINNNKYINVKQYAPIAAVMFKTFPIVNTVYYQG